MPFNKEFLDMLNASAQRGAQGAIDSTENQRQEGVKIEAEKAKREAALQKLQAWLQGPNGKRAFHDGDVSVGQDDSETKLLMAQMKQQALNDARDAKLKEKQRDGLVAMGKRIDSADIPQAKDMANDLKSILPPEGEDFKSYGPLMNAVPNMGIGLMETLGLAPKGAYNERQVLERGKMLMRHKVAGSNVTPSEKASFDSALGAGIGQSSADLRTTIGKLSDLPDASLRNIERSTDGEVVKQYRENGGVASAPQAPAAPAAPAAPMSFEEFKIRKAQGKL